MSKSIVYSESFYNKIAPAALACYGTIETLEEGTPFPTYTWFCNLAWSDFFWSRRRTGGVW
jgi:hypothetical protein